MQHGEAAILILLLSKTFHKNNNSPNKGHSIFYDLKQCYITIAK